MASISLTCAATGTGNASLQLKKQSFTLYTTQGNGAVYAFTFYFDSTTHQTS